jgi:hypothetical protein
MQVDLTNIETCGTCSNNCTQHLATAQLSDPNIVGVTYDYDNAVCIAICDTGYIDCTNNFTCGTPTEECV